MDHVAEIWMTIVGLSMNLGALAQSVRIIRRKKSDDVSLVHPLVILQGQAWWLWYGVYKNSLSLIITNIIGIMFLSSVAILIAKYRSKSIFPWRKSQQTSTKRET